MDDLKDRRIRLAVTILYTLPRRLVDPDSTDGTGTYRPEWFLALLRDDPALVADVVCRTAARKLASGVQEARELRELAEIDDYREVAALAALPVLKGFPRADTAASLVSLCWVLHAALERCDRAVVDRVIGERLERGGQPAGERACWASAGYFTAPDRYGADIRALAEDDEGLTWLVMFVELASVPRSDVWRSLAASDIEPAGRRTWGGVPQEHPDEQGVLVRGGSDRQVPGRHEQVGRGSTSGARKGCRGGTVVAGDQGRA